MLRLFLNKFIIPVVRIDYDIQRATGYQVSVFAMCSWEKKIYQANSAETLIVFFLRVAVIQRRKVRRTVFRNLRSVSVKTVKYRKAKIPVSFVYPDCVFESPPICPRTRLETSNALSQLVQTQYFPSAIFGNCSAQSFDLLALSRLSGVS